MKQRDNPEIMTQTIENKEMAPTTFCKNRCRYEDYVNTELYKAFKPIFFSMKIFGLYCCRDYEVDRHGTKIPWNKKYTPSTIYSFLVLLGMILNSVRMIGPLASSDVQLIVIVFYGWMILCIMNTLSCFVGCMKYHAIPEFFLEWQRACPEMRANCMGKVKRLVIILTILCWILTILNFSFGIYNIIFTSSFDHYLYPVERDDFGSLAMKSFAIVIHGYFSATWVFPVALSYLVCHVLTVEFKFLGEDIEESSDFKRKSLAENIEHFRWKHVKYTAMVGHANDFLTYHLAASCLLNMVSVDSYFKILVHLHHVCSD